MNYKLIFRLLSFVMVAMALALLLSLGVAALFREHLADSDARFAFAMSAGVALVLAAMFHLIGRGSETRFFRKEALCFIGTGWILASIVGALPYALVLPDSPFANALFESVSGFTTTGASVLTDLEALPRSLLFWRCLTQWIGGLGVVVLFVAILGFLGAGGKILFTHESTGRSADIEHGRVKKGVLELFCLYGALSAACLLVLRLCGMSWYDAICHAFTTVSTGGFSTRNLSIAAYSNPLIEWAIIAFMILGATNFFFLLFAVRRDWRQAKRFTEVFAYVAILAAGTLLFFLFVQAHAGRSASLHDSLRGSAFQVVAIATTTGFGSEDFTQWPLFTKMSLLALMVIGGCSASTAGGAKVARIVVAVRVGLQDVERSFRTHVVRPVMMNGKPIDDEQRNAIISYLVLLGLILLVSLPIFGFLESGHSLEGALSAVIASLFNIGPGFAEFGPMENYAGLTSPAKIYLSLLMILGRLELFAILALLAPSLWRKFS